MPKFIFGNDLNEITCQLKRVGGFHSDVNVKLTENNEFTEYCIKVFELVNTLSKKNSLKFSQIILKQYPLDICLSIIDSDQKYLPRLRDQLAMMIKNIHLAYSRLSIRNIPKNIQFIIKSHADYEKRTIELFSLAEKSLMHQDELNLTKINNIDLSKIPTYFNANQKWSEIVFPHNYNSFCLVSLHF